MGLFSKIFGRPTTRELVSTFKTLNAYTPAFATWRGGIYESELCRSAIEASARQASKLNIEAVGSGAPEIMKRLEKRPCSWMTWSQFFARAMTILEVENTLFIVPVLDNYGETVGVYPIRPASYALVEDKRGVPFIRFKFDSGDCGAMELSKVGIMTRQQYSSDYFGDSAKALIPTLDLISMQNQGIKEGIKSGASFRFFAQMANFASDEDLAHEQQRFTEKSMRSGGGVLLFPNTYKDIRQLENKPYMISAEEIKAIRTNVFDYFNTNESVIQSSAKDEELDAFFNCKIEPFAIQMGEVLTNMIFSENELRYHNRIYVAANRLQYMSVSHKVSLAKELGDRGAIMIDEIRELFNYPPLPDGAGQKAPARGEYYDMIAGKGE